MEKMEELKGNSTDLFWTWDDNISSAVLKQIIGSLKTIAYIAKREKTVVHIERYEKSITHIEKREKRLSKQADPSKHNYLFSNDDDSKDNEKLPSEDLYEYKTGEDFEKKNENLSLIGLPERRKPLPRKEILPRTDVEEYWRKLKWNVNHQHHRWLGPPGKTSNKW